VFESASDARDIDDVDEALCLLSDSLCMAALERHCHFSDVGVGLRSEDKCRHCAPLPAQQADDTIERSRALVDRDKKRSHRRLS
jgi:hypothetical protein